MKWKSRTAAVMNVSERLVLAHKAPLSIEGVFFLTPLQNKTFGLSWFTDKSMMSLLLETSDATSYQKCLYQI